MKKLFLLLAFVAISLSFVFSQGCLPEGITFTTQEEIDNFQANYPGCTEIEGDVLIGSWSGISNYDIQNLEGLNNIVKIGGRLEIIFCQAIGDLSGLNSLTQVDDYLIIYNCTELDNLSGLNSLTHVGGGFVIALNNILTNIEALESLNSISDGLWIEYNVSLASLTGLDNLISVDSSINIDHNDNLVDISALKNINANSVHNYIVIKYNYNLSDCAIQSICDYLTNPVGLISISNNSQGCNSPEEVQLACLNYVEDRDETIEISLFPNPASDFITVVAPQSQEIEEIIFYNQLGQVVLSVREVTNSINISNLSPGIYFAAVRTSDRKLMTKVIIE